MSASARLQPDSHDSSWPEPVRLAAAAAERWAGSGLVALLLSGSHASGEAVTLEWEGRRLLLSDLDLYAVMRDEPSAQAAAARCAAERAALAGTLRAAGLLGPLEVAFVTFAGLARMPARPGTVELARSARVLAGDASALTRLPRWSAAEVGAEERLLLLENRAFELLAAVQGGSDPLSAARARHGLLKAALELAASHALAGHQLPAGAAARVAAARARGPWNDSPSWLAGAWEPLQPVWDTAIAWRQQGASTAPSDPAEWRRVVRAWCAEWWEASAVFTPETEPWARALAAAARAPLRRRLRRAFEAAGPFRGKLRHAAAGTPQHRIHGSAVVLLIAAAESAAEPRLPAGALHALRVLGVSSDTSFAAASRTVLQAWDRDLQGGVRGAEFA